MCPCTLQSTKLLFVSAYVKATLGLMKCACCPSVQETQTKPEGQIHFFPVLFKGDKLYDLLVERCGSSQTSAPES